jgi:hypothetical protein
VALRKQGATQLPAQIYHTLVLSFRLDRRLHWPDQTELEITVNNLFDEMPPYDAAASNGFSRFGDPRGRSYAVFVVTTFD